MPIFFYQSFEGPGSTENSIEAMLANQYTRSNHDQWAKRNAPGKGALLYPLPREENLQKGGAYTAVVSGPPALAPSMPKGTMVKGSSVTDFEKLMKHKVLNNRQAIIREMGFGPDVSAFGELDGGSNELSWMKTHVGQLSGMTTNRAGTGLDTQRKFTVYANNAGNVRFLADGTGFYAIDYLGFVVVFVHVPNDIAKNAGPGTKDGKKAHEKAMAQKARLAALAKAPGAKSGQVVMSGRITKKGKATALHNGPGTAGPVIEATYYGTLKNFYAEIRNAVGKPIDLIIGDTNQPRASLTPEVVTSVMNDRFLDALTTNTLQPIDTHGHTLGGTNSTFQSMFDVAVYNAATVIVKKYCYVSQQGKYGDTHTAASVSDHMGIAVHIERKP